MVGVDVSGNPTYQQGQRADEYTAEPVEYFQGYQSADEQLIYEPLNNAAEQEQADENVDEQYSNDGVYMTQEEEKARKNGIFGKKFKKNIISTSKNVGKASNDKTQGKGLKR